LVRASSRDREFRKAIRWSCNSRVGARPHGLKSPSAIAWGGSSCGLNTEMASIFEQVVALQDRYGLHAYLTALENAGLRGRLESELRANARLSHRKKTIYSTYCKQVDVAFPSPQRWKPPRRARQGFVIRFLEISNHILFWYYTASNMAYLVMLIVALKTTAAITANCRATD